MKHDWEGNRNFADDFAESFALGHVFEEKGKNQTDKEIILCLVRPFDMPFKYYSYLESFCQTD